MELQEEPKPDRIVFSIRNGSYNIDVRGKRNAKGTEDYLVSSSGGNDLMNAVNGLIHYDFECRDLLREKGTRFGTKYLGAGSDPGRYEYPWMIDWKLELQDKLPKSHQELLEGVVHMHNCHVYSLREMEDINRRLKNLEKTVESV